MSDKKLRLLLKTRETALGHLLSQHLDDYALIMRNEWFWGGELPKPPLRLRQLFWEISTLKEVLKPRFDCKKVGKHDCPDCKHGSQEGEGSGKYQKSWCFHCKKVLSEELKEKLNK